MIAVDRDIEWEFNAPRWCDFSQEDVENPDVWFEQEEEKAVTTKVKIPIPLDTGRRPTRIPVSRAMKTQSRQIVGTKLAKSVSQSALVTSILKPDQYAQSRDDEPHQNVYGRRPVRVPVREKRITR
jgi:hypothetical protein